MAKKTSSKLVPIDLEQFKKTLSNQEEKDLINTLRTRFNANMHRHEDLDWSEIKEKLQSNSQILQSLNSMEITGGEPDVVDLQDEKGVIVFIDCSTESPIGRRSICYDHKGHAERIKKGVFPAGNALDLAEAMGIDLINEDQYRLLQGFGEFDLKTSSWLQTPTNIRKLGGAIFADRRYNHVFVYHNGAQSFYSARGFRGAVKLLD